MWAIQLPSLLACSVRQQQIPISWARKILTTSKNLSSRLPTVFPWSLQSVLHSVWSSTEGWTWGGPAMKGCHVVVNWYQPSSCYHHPKSHGLQLPCSIGMNRWRSFDKIIPHVLFSLLYLNSSTKCCNCLVAGNSGAIHLQIKVSEVRCYWAGFHHIRTHLANKSHRAWQFTDIQVSSKSCKTRLYMKTVTAVGDTPQHLKSH